MTRVFGLSKSKLMAFRQCPRRLWLSVHRPDCVPADDTNEAVLATGTDVGVIARQGWPDGLLIAPDGPLTEALSQTQTALAARKPLFEATVQRHGVLVRADVLVPTPRGPAFDLIEVKSSTRVKDYQLEDVAIQSQIFAAAGVPLRRRVLQYINNAFVYPGGGRYHEVRPDGSRNSLFAAEDVTEAVESIQAEVPGWIDVARRTLAGAMPDETDGCNDPYPCPYQAFCHAQAPEYPLSCLPRIRAEAIAALAEKGYKDVRDIPAGVLTVPAHEWVRQVTCSGQPELRPGARAALAVLDYPRYYLDFETIQFAVPIWPGTRPYEQLPFQWSCHVEKKDKTLTHQEFLDLSGEAPMRTFAESLLTTLKTAGPILVYNQAFEGRIIRELAARFPDLGAALTALLPRLVDLLPLTRAHYYHPDMKGSWSIKAVLPTIAPDLDYATLDGVQDGGQAQQAYLEAITSETPTIRKNAIERSLKAYCERDTEAMVRLVRFLRARPGVAP
ncbi:MAG: DUF2779 domain-containing protein [Acidiferrobacter sp.]